ncbi:MAG: hypothetical protein NKF70_11090 [Methanobacterium sp. ERen5]|nr:MAG: hypothetical protein NKF70_11090 [Methanobacterium sp. ERen5]
MNFPEWFNQFYWWAILTLIILSITICKIFTVGLTTSLDLLMVLILFALLLVPIFDEMVFFGFKFKKEIDSLKTDLTSQIINLRSDIQMNVNQNSIINVGQVPSDQELPKIEKKINNTIENNPAYTEFENETGSLITEVSDDIKFLFTIRYLIEKEIREIYQLTSFVEDSRHNSIKILKELKQNEIIPPYLANAIREVITVCNPAIHGEDVSKVQINFVKELAPKIIHLLRIYKNKYE